MALGFVYILLGQTFSTLASPTHQPQSLKLVLNPYPPSLHLQSQPSPSPSIFDLNPHPPSLRSQALTPHRHRTNEVRVLCLSLSLFLWNQKKFRETHIRFCKVQSSMAFHFHSIFFYNIPMVDLNSLACMWVSHDVNLLDHKDRWGLTLSFGRLCSRWVWTKFKIWSCFYGCMLFWDGRFFYSCDFDLRLCLYWICFDVWWKSLYFQHRILNHL